MNTPAPPSSSSGSSDDGHVAVEHDAAGSRFLARVEGHEAIAEYRMAPGTMRMTHTEVPDALQGRGVAAALVRKALAHARREGLKVEPLCAYVRSYMDRHPDTRDVRAP